MPSSHLILCRPLLLLPPIPPSVRVFSNESTLHMRWPKYWSSSFSIIPSKEIPGLISFRMDWLDILAVQRTLKSLLQYHSSKASILRRSAFFRRRQWHPTPVLLSEKSHGQRSLVGCSPWGHEESDTTERNGTPLQYSCLENPMGRGAWQAVVHGVSKSQTRLSDFIFILWRRKWQPIPVFLPGESQGWGSLVG